MLVVISIIAVLTGLLLPAVLAAREKARVAECMHRQGELGKGMSAYEIAKNHFPGYANTLKGKIVSWAPLMLPYVGRTDLWEGGWRDGNTPVGYVSQFVCPSDTPTVDCPLSYVVNVGKGQPVLPSPPLGPLPPSDDPADTSAGITQVGVFRNLTLPASCGTVKLVSVADMKSASRRPMIAESAYNISVNDTVNSVRIAAETSRQWTDFDLSTTPFANRVVKSERFGFLFWPNGPTVSSPNNPVVGARNASTGVVLFGAIVPIHKGLVNITFCDGHTESVSDDPSNTCNQYDWDDIK
jgi:prepilin-type processing-associated H-X9-DG protein